MSEAFLALYRAARDFTRRAIDGVALEAAALDYARARGWVPASEARHVSSLRQNERIAELEQRLAQRAPVPLVVNVQANADATIAEQRKRIAELESAVRTLLAAQARPAPLPFVEQSDVCQTCGGVGDHETGCSRGYAARIAELEAALRYAIELLDKHDRVIAVRHLRAVLG